MFPSLCLKLCTFSYFLSLSFLLTLCLICHSNYTKTPQKIHRDVQSLHSPRPPMNLHLFHAASPSCLLTGTAPKRSKIVLRTHMQAQTRMWSCVHTNKHTCKYTHICSPQRFNTFILKIFTLINISQYASHVHIIPWLLKPG